MPNWSDPLEIVHDAQAFQKLNLALLGLSTWEVINQLPFDWSFIRRRRDAHWPLFVYEYCKYSLWFAVIGVNVVLNVTTKVDCQSLYVFNQFAGNTAIGSASTLLMLRTIAVWNRNILVTLLLVVLSLGQWGILFHGIATVKSSWSDVAQACVVDAVPPVFVELIYLYTMSFDLIVLALTAIGLIRSPGRSSLWHLLFRQGIIYFIVAFLCNLIAATFLLLNLNPIMNIMFTIPAATFTSIVACRAFVSLSSFRAKDLYVHSRSSHTPGATPNTPSRKGVVSSLGTTVVASGGTRRVKKTTGKDKLNVIAGIAFRGIDSLGGDLYEREFGQSQVQSRGITTTMGAPGEGNISMDDLESKGGDRKYPALGEEVDGDEEFVTPDLRARGDARPGSEIESQGGFVKM